MQETIYLMLATNDHSNGNPTGRVRVIEFESSETLRLDWSGCGEPVCKLAMVRDGNEPAQPFIQIHRWDSVRVTTSTAAKIANYLRKKREWSPDGGAVDLWDKWKSGKAFVGRDFADAE